MRTISLKEMQQIELKLLLEFDRVCKQQNLRYFIDGGTLLGAVCYDGFIPWDDDIDIKMPRPDYERLLTMQKEFSPYILLDAPRRGHCEFTFLKLIDTRTVLEERQGNSRKTTGVYIDILPMDGHPGDPSKCKRHLDVLSRYNSLFHASTNGFSNLRTSKSLRDRFKGMVYKQIYSTWGLYKKLDKTAKKYSYTEADRVGLVVEGDPIRERFEKAWLEPAAMMLFEGAQFPAPNEAEKHLSIFYQKPISRELYYQKLPYIPPQHNHVVYWKEDACLD